MISLLLRTMSQLPSAWIEVLVMLQLYALAAVYIVKELLFEVMLPSFHLILYDFIADYILGYKPRHKETS